MATLVTMPTITFFIDARMQRKLHLIEQHNLLIRELLCASHLHMDYIITNDA